MQRNNDWIDIMMPSWDRLRRFYTLSRERKWQQPSVQRSRIDRRIRDWVHLRILVEAVTTLIQSRTLRPYIHRSRIKINITLFLHYLFCLLSFVCFLTLLFILHLLLLFSCVCAPLPSSLFSCSPSYSVISFPRLFFQRLIPFFPCR